MEIAYTVRGRPATLSHGRVMQTLRRSRSSPAFIAPVSMNVHQRVGPPCSPNFSRRNSSLRPASECRSIAKASPEAAILMSKRRQAENRGEPSSKATPSHRRDYGYPGNANDKLILRFPPKTKLERSDVVNIFEFPRTLHERYEISDTIGHGSFGTVYRAVDRKTGEVFACKSIPKIPRGEDFTNPHYLLKIRSEVDIMSHLGSSLDAVFLVGEYEDDSYVHIVMELCDGGTLMDAVAATESTEQDVALVMRSVFRFLALCHSRDVIYRDVKPENFLFMSDKTKGKTLKATDFGLAIRHPEGSPPLTLAAGTPVYVAPEVFERCYGKPADIYSAGVLAFHLLTGRYPYWPDMNFPSPSIQQLQKIIVSSSIDFSKLDSEGVSELAQDFLRQVLVRDPSLRITAAGALHHPWLQQAGVESATEDWVPLAGTAVQRLQRYAVHSLLKRKVLAMIFEDLMAEGDDETLGQIAARDLIEPLRSIFQLMDPSEQGSATINDIVAELTREGYCLTDAETHQLLESLDTDHDGVVAFSEFAASLLDWDQIVQSTRWEGLVKRAFERLDLNQDGSISLDEVMELLQQTPGESPAEHKEVAYAVIRDFDANYDGQISWQEFYQILSQDNTMDVLECFDKRQSSSLSLASGSLFWDSSSSASLDDAAKDEDSQDLQW